MLKRKLSLKPQRGAIPTFEVIVLVLLLGVIGYVVWNGFYNKPKTDNNVVVSGGHKKKTTATTPAPAPDPYSGWKTGTLANEKISFMYPPEWKLENQPYDITTPNDRVTLSGPNNLQVHMWTGAYGVGGACPGCSVVFKEPISAIGRPLYLNYVSGNSSSTNVSVLYLYPGDCVQGCWMETKNINIPNTTQKALMSFYIDYDIGAPDNTKKMPLDDWKNDPNIAKAKLILQSLHY